MKTRSISFVFPMFNEAESIRETIRRSTSLAGEICADHEIIVVDDASTDRSGDIVDGMAHEDGRIRSIRLKTNTKFGGALAAGLRHASKEVIIYTDSDFPAKEDDIKKALDLLDDSDIVSAYSLVIKDTSFKRIIMSKVYNFLIRLLFRLKLKDINAGLKIYRRSIVEGLDLRSKSPFIDVEIFVEALKRNARIKQYGLVFDLRTNGTSTISRLDVVMRTFWDMFAYKFLR